MGAVLLLQGEPKSLDDDWYVQRVFEHVWEMGITELVEEQGAADNGQCSKPYQSTFHKAKNHYPCIFASKHNKCCTAFRSRHHSLLQGAVPNCYVNGTDIAVWCRWGWPKDWYGIGNLHARSGLEGPKRKDHSELFQEGRISTWKIGRFIKSKGEDDWRRG